MNKIIIPAKTGNKKTIFRTSVRGLVNKEEKIVASPKEKNTEKIYE